MSNRLAVFDADGLIFFAGWAFKDQLNKVGELGAIRKVDKIIQSILEKVNADHYIGFFSSDSPTKNFRHKIAKRRPYKGQRKSEEWQDYFKPIIKKRFQEKWGFHPLDDLEADDAVIIAHHQFKEEYNVIHISEDKDMLQLGDFVRFNPKTKLIESFKYEDGIKFLYSQLLHGDSTDNIIGIEGIGAGTKKHKLVTKEMAKVGNTSRNAAVMHLWTLEPVEETLFEYVKDIYIGKYGEDALEFMLETYVLLKMVDKPLLDYPKKVNMGSIKADRKYVTKKLLNI